MSYDNAKLKAAFEAFTGKPVTPEMLADAKAEIETQTFAGQLAAMRKTVAMANAIDKKIDPSGYATLTPEQKAAVDAFLPAAWNVPQPYEELLEARVKQLKEIDERLERIDNLEAHDDVRLLEALDKEIRSLRLDLGFMIQTAEHEAARF
jgi:hypothetical protein